MGELSSDWIKGPDLAYNQRPLPDDCHPVLRNQPIGRDPREENASPRTDFLPSQRRAGPSISRWGPPCPTRLDPTALWSPVSIDRFRDILATQKSTSGPGLDGMTYREVKLLFRMDPVELIEIINECITEGHPTEYKLAKVVVIPKPGRRIMTSSKSYRCTSLLNTIAKLAEKVIAEYLTLCGEQLGWWRLD